MSADPTAAAAAAGTYPTWVGLVYVLNLMVGTGALALPRALAAAGWALGPAALLLLAALSLLAAALLLEAQAATCALRRARRDCAPRPSHYTLGERVELADMARELLGARGGRLVSAALCLYLYGDLSIYSAAIASSLREVVCEARPPGAPDEAACWAAGGVSRGACYRACLLLGTALLAPLSLAGLQRTRGLQLATSLARWLALGAMVALAALRLARHGAQGAPAPASAAGLPALLGTCVYSFMWHHSLPGLVAPMRSTRGLAARLAAAYALAAAAYLLLALTGAFAFPALDALYTLNFPELPGLALLPAAVLCASYPLVSVTLRRNLQALSGCARPAAALAATVPPLLLALLVRDAGELVSVTGGVAGAAVQYWVPARLALAARARGCGDNPHASPLRHALWPRLLQAWAALCVGLLAARQLGVFTQS